MSPTIQRILIILSASVLFGFSWPTVRGAYLEGANNICVIMVTTFLRGVFLAGFCFYKKQSIFENKADLVTGLRSGFVQAVSVIGILGSMVYLQAPIAIVLLFTSTLMLLFFLWFKGEIEINKWLLITTAICFVGISFVVDVWNAKLSDNLIGYILIAVGAIATTSRMYIFGRQVQHKPPAVVGAQTFVFAFLFLLLLPLYKMPELPHTMLGYVWVILGGLTASLATFAMFFAIAKVGSFHFSLYNKLEPVFGSIFSAILIGEILGIGQYIGMLIVIGSLVSYQVWDHRRKTNLPVIE